MPRAPREDFLRPQVTSVQSISCHSAHRRSGPLSRWTPTVFRSSSTRLHISCCTFYALIWRKQWFVFRRSTCIFSSLLELRVGCSSDACQIGVDHSLSSVIFTAVLCGRLYWDTPEVVSPSRIASPSRRILNCVTKVAMYVECCRRAFRE